MVESSDEIYRDVFADMKKNVFIRSPLFISWLHRFKIKKKISVLILINIVEFITLEWSLKILPWNLETLDPPIEVTK